MTEPSMSEPGKPEPSPARARRRPRSLAELPFPRHPAVRWFNPPTLLETAKHVALSAVFGSYADKREVQAAMPVPPFHDHSGEESCWVDYVSDLGDGFDATYSVAYLLGQPKLDIAVPDQRGGTTVATTRGQLLVMGGDEVYPSASARAYEERTKGPYHAALPHSADPAPALYAVPGNHDWYDGLTSFLRFFCQGAWIGGWQTRQRRSYFAVKLPNRWWLLGIDIQFDTYIDAPQIEYFRAAAAHIQAGDGIILCTAKPSWVEGGREQSEAYATIDYFVTEVLRKPPEQVRLMLAGDTHHYVRYAEIGGDRTLVTCGGGGAYLSATSRDDEPLVLPPASLHADRVEPPPGSQFAWQAAYPSPEESRRLAWRIFQRLPQRNPWFVALMSLTQGLLALVFLTARTPGILLAGAVVLAGAVGFYRQGKAPGYSGGLLHGAAQLGVAAGLSLGATAVPLPASWPDAVQLWLRAGGVALVGGVVATLLVAGYLLVCSRFGIHVNELFSAQSDEDHKSFLRMHLRDDGSLVLYPVAVPRVSRSWQVPPGDGPGDPWVVPAQDIPAELIEPPVTVRREARPT